MAERVFCIDFGSGFTKVALRPDPGATARLVNDRDVETADFCFPSVVVIDRTGPKPVAEFGTKAAGRTASNGIEVHANWKKRLFLTSGPDDPTANPLEAFLRSDDLARLASQHGVTTGQLGHLRQVVASAREMLTGLGISPPGKHAQQQQFAASLAVHFFSWLRQEVLKECDKLPHAGLRYDGIPVRLTVPAFAHGADVTTHPGCQLLTAAAAKAGWPLHPTRPVVSEPYSNAVGVLTKGVNLLKKDKFDLGGTFGKGPLVTALKDPEHYAPYRTVVIDVGAYTTDFAVLTMRPDGVEADPDRAFAVREHSVALGMSDLDERVFRVLPAAKAAWLRARSADEVDGFRETVYTEGKPIRSGALGPIGAGAELEAVRAAVADFGAALASEVQRFLAPLDAGGLSELVLTGGGMFVPALRDAVLTAAQADGRDFAKLHGPGLKKATAGKPVDKLDPRFTRGGSALGGAGLYFEPDYA